MNERAKKLSSVMAESGSEMFKKNLKLLDQLIIKLEENPNALLEISEIKELDSVSSQDNADIESESSLSENIVVVSDKEKEDDDIPTEIDNEKSLSDNIVDLSDKEKDENPSEDDIIFVPVNNPKGRPKTKTKQKSYSKIKSNSPVINSFLLAEDDLEKRLLSNIALVKHSSVYLTNNIIFCFLETLMNNLKMKIFIFDSLNQIEIGKFDCNYYMFRNKSDKKIN